ncbi:MAG: zinc-ribbon domain-containing protein [Candidatus Thorarchaeota archaeon]
MKYCENCGAAVDESNKFCPSCGYTLADEGSPSKIQTIKQQPDIQMASESKLPQLVARSYWIWFLISLVLSIFSMIYLYLNFEDLNKLNQYPRPKEVSSTEVNMTTIIILGIISIICGLGFFIMPYIIYLKFKLLYDYINSHPTKQNTIPISGQKYVKYFFICIGIVIIGLIFIALSQTVFYSMGDFLPIFSMIIGNFIAFIPVIVFGIYMLIQSAKWQEAYNERAYIVSPNTLKKDLF